MMAGDMLGVGASAIRDWRQHEVAIVQTMTAMRSDSPIVHREVAVMLPPNGSRLSCDALKKDSLPNLRAPSASRAC